MLRLGLCCQFHEAPIRFRTTTAAALLRLPRAAALEKLSELCLHNAQTLLEALRYCATRGIGSFRVMSQILPVKTHPTAGYEVDELPAAIDVRAALAACRDFARERDVRLTFHPDQYVVLNSPRPEVVESAVAELESQAQVAAWIGADVINVHAGGGYGQKADALDRLRRALDRLSPGVRERLTLENDDRVYTPRDLLPICRAAGIPLVYDVHHHRVLPDGLSVADATAAALGTWNREPLFHISSPRHGWNGPGPERHHDVIDLRDFPAEWENLTLTVEVEAKTKEVAIRRLRRGLARRRGRRHGHGRRQCAAS